MIWWSLSLHYLVSCQVSLDQPDAELWESITPIDGTCPFGEEFRGAAGICSETSEFSIWPACSQGLPASLRGVYLTMNFIFFGGGAVYAFFLRLPATVIERLLCKRYIHLTCMHAYIHTHIHTNLFAQPLICPSSPYFTPYFVTLKSPELTCI